MKLWSAVRCKNFKAKHHRKYSMSTGLTDTRAGNGHYAVYLASRDLAAVQGLFS